HFVEYFGADRQVSVSRELTKLYEETVRGTAEEVLMHFTDKPAKGEIVIVVGGKK
ncbi:MAG: 16S rRNA (cytidine1402-2'-O)-methyltransferase, partial [Maribacter sp.]